MCEDYIKELSNEMGIDIHEFYNNEHNESIEKIISEVCKTKEELLENYSDLRNAESKATDVKFAFGKSGSYTCGIFSPLVYYDVVAGNAHKGKCVNRLEEVTADEYEKCFFVGNKLIYAESYIDGKKTDDIFFIETEDRVLACIYDLDGTVKEVDETVYKNGFIFSYTMIYGFPGLEKVVQWSRYEYEFSESGISKLVVKERFKDTDEYTFENENGFVKSFSINGNVFEVTKKISAFADSIK
mgnify:CR=1 FL=1